MDKDFINHSAPLENNGKEGMWHTFKNILKPAFPDLMVVIDVIDMVKIENGKYKEHWGINTFEKVLNTLARG